MESMKVKSFDKKKKIISALYCKIEREKGSEEEM
jgi:hypothetical protein